MSSSRLAPRKILQRTWRSLRRTGSSSEFRLIYHPDYTLTLPFAEIDAHRARNILSFLGSEHLVGRREVLRPRSVSMRRLREVHEVDYLQSLEDPASLTPIYGEALPAPLHDRVLTTHRLMVGGTVLGALRAWRRGRRVINLGGGFHHARPGRGAGFCVFNDLAVAVQVLRDRGFEGRILIIDLDIHDGDGTRVFFAEDESVHTFSIHNVDLESTAAVASTSVALGDEVDDEIYLTALERHLPRVIDEFRPELVFYLAGVDPAHDDKMGTWQISAAGLLKRDQRVIELLRKRAGDLPLVTLLAGGYGQGAWRYTARFASWMLNRGVVIEPTGTTTRALAHYRRVAKLLGETRDGSEDDASAWSLSAEDLPGSMTTQPKLLLGRYTVHAVEYAVDRYGLLDHLRRQGFSHLRFDFDLESPAGETVRLLAGEDEDLVVVEARLLVDRQSTTGHSLLRIEWLLIQDPRSGTRGEQGLLPGQQHPGLGLVRDVVALLILACEQLGLSGVIFAPSHYHIAVQTERLFGFLDARADASFHKLQEALRGHSLRESALLLDEGRVVDELSGEPYVWDPAPMILILKDALRDQVRPNDYDQQVEEAKEKYSYRVVEKDPS